MKVVSYTSEVILWVILISWKLAKTFKKSFGPIYLAGSRPLLYSPPSFLCSPVQLWKIYETLEFRELIMIMSVTYHFTILKSLYDNITHCLMNTSSITFKLYSTNQLEYVLPLDFKCCVFSSALISNRSQFLLCVPPWMLDYSLRMVGGGYRRHSSYFGPGTAD